MAAPAAVFLMLFFVYGLFYGLMTSLGYNRIIGKSEFTWDFYRKVLSGKEFWVALEFTGKTALISSGAALLLTVTILFLMYINLSGQYFKGKIFQKIIESPLMIPYLAASYLILVLLMQRGLLSSFFLKLGIIKDYKQFPILTNDREGLGIIIAYIWKTTPFMVMTAMPVLVRASRKWENLGKILDMKRITFFLKVILPIIFPTLLMSYFIVLSYLFTSFEVPYILGVTYPKALSVSIYDIYSKGDLGRRGELMVMNILISVISLGIGMLIYLINKKLFARGGSAWD